MRGDACLQPVATPSDGKSGLDAGVNRILFMQWKKEGRGLWVYPQRADAGDAWARAFNSASPSGMISIRRARIFDAGEGEN